MDPVRKYSIYAARPAIAAFPGTVAAGGRDWD
jgi:hypothetical protein